MVEFYLKLKLILRIISYLTYICWEIDNFVIKSDIFRRFFICKNILKKLSCYHDNYFRYFMFGNTMVLSARRGSVARVSASLRSRRYSRARENGKLEIPPAQKRHILSSPRQLSAGAF